MYTTKLFTQGKHPICQTSTTKMSLFNMHFSLHPTQPLWCRLRQDGWPGPPSGLIGPARPEVSMAQPSQRLVWPGPPLGLIGPARPLAWLARPDIPSAWERRFILINTTFCWCSISLSCLPINCFIPYRLWIPCTPPTLPTSPLSS